MKLFAIRIDMADDELLFPDLEMGKSVDGLAVRAPLFFTHGSFAHTAPPPPEMTNEVLRFSSSRCWRS